MSPQASQIVIQESIQAILSLTTELEQVMAHENDCLDKLNHEKFIELQSVKSSLAKNYEMEAQKILLMREKIKGLTDDSMRTKLKEAHKRFEMMAEKNVSVLMSRKKSVQKLNERILNAAKTELAKGKSRETYTALGAADKQEQKTVSAHIGETV